MTSTVQPGVFVLGMHRSGTSVVAGLLDRLGLDAGPRSSMVSADEFNSDGYWEQRPVVEWHNRALARLRSWASAPAPADDEAVRGLAGDLAASANALLAGLYTDAWFLKDPRQCLLLPLWTQVRGDRDLPVVVFRHPAAVVRSLTMRNAYHPELASALWERYTHASLAGVAGRSCVVVRYEDLLDEPETQTAIIAAAVADHLDRSPADAETIVHAAGLVRAGRDDGRDGDVSLTTEQKLLLEALDALTGRHGRLAVPDLPSPSASSETVVARRRRRLNAVRPLIHVSSSARATLDRIPARLRRR